MASMLRSFFFILLIASASLNPLCKSPGKQTVTYSNTKTLEVLCEAGPGYDNWLTILKRGGNQVDFITDRTYTEY